MKTQSIFATVKARPGHNIQYVMDKLLDCLREELKEHYPRGVLHYFKGNETTKLSVSLTVERRIDGQSVYNQFKDTMQNDFHGELEILSFQYVSEERMEYVIAEPHTIPIGDPRDDGWG